MSIKNNIKELSPKGFEWISILHLNLFYIGIGGFCLALPFQFSSIVYIFLAIEFILLVFMVILVKTVNTSNFELLNIDMKLYCYHDCLLLYAKHIPKWRKYLTNYYQYLLAQAEHYRGDFEQSLVRLENLDAGRLNKKHSEQVLVSFTFLVLMNRLQLQKPVDLDLFVRKIAPLSGGEDIGERMRAIYVLMYHRIPNDYYDAKQAQTNLQEAVFNYYRAINADLSGDSIQARTLLEKVADGNPEFYFVRLARKRLEEKENVHS